MQSNTLLWWKVWLDLLIVFELRRNLRSKHEELRFNLPCLGDHPAAHLDEEASEAVYLFFAAPYRRFKPKTSPMTTTSYRWFLIFPCRRRVHILGTMANRSVQRILSPVEASWTLLIHKTSLPWPFLSLNDLQWLSFSLCIEQLQWW